MKPSQSIWLIRLLASTYFSFLSFASHIIYMKSSQSIGLFLFSYSRVSLPFPSLLILHIWSWVHPLAYSFSRIHVFLFPSLHFSYYIWSWVHPLAYSLFSYSRISLPFPSFSYCIWSWRNPLAYSFSRIHVFLFPSLHFSYYIWSRVNLLAYFLVLHTRISLSFPFTSHITYEVESIHWLIPFLVFTYFSSLSLHFSYCIWSWRNPLASSFSRIHVFLFPFPSLLILHMKLSPSIGLFFFSYSRISLLFPSLSYYIWSRVNPLAYSLSCIHVFLFLSLHFHIVYEVDSIHWLILFLVFTYFSFPCFILIYSNNIKSSQSICLFICLHSPISLIFCLTWYIIPTCVNVFLHIHSLLFS